MKKTKMLRKFLNGPGLKVIPCAYDCLSARMAESVGFKALFMTGYGIRDAQLGMPDFGIATATEVVNIVRNMVNSVDVPFIVDADDGYGGALAAYRTTRELIRAGAAGLFLDDQKHPTKRRGGYNRPDESRGGFGRRYAAAPGYRYHQTKIR
jgi:methylisocitrate lyase